MSTIDAFYLVWSNCEPLYKAMVDYAAHLLDRWPDISDTALGRNVRDAVIEWTDRRVVDRPGIYPVPEHVWQQLDAIDLRTITEADLGEGLRDASDGGSVPLTRASEAAPDPEADTFWHTVQHYDLGRGPTGPVLMVHDECHEAVLDMADFDSGGAISLSVLLAMVEAHEYHVHHRDTRFTCPPF